ncbi:MAG: type II secretion system protein GspC [Woeseia sp.]|nr:type II secretion system protein GspC [Woeseia sp.]NNL54635.1 type II secretion system protein GspC [Woeseia sp.]
MTSNMTINAKWPDFSNLDADRLIATASRTLPYWVTLGLVVLLAWQLARLAWLLVPGSSTGDAIIAPLEVSKRAAQSDNSADVQSIATAHLFGEANALDVEAQPSDLQPLEDLEETDLSLVLKGTIAAASEDQSIAIIADSRNDEKIYSIGDTVASGTKLHAVYMDRVVLNRSGALEVLKLPREFPESRPPARRTAQRTRSSARATPQRSIQNVVAQNVTKLADVIRPTPYFVNGQQQGYRVYPGRNRRQFAALGLRPGDLIKDIDGAALTDPQQAMQIFQSLGTAEQVSVTVERNGQPETLVLNTNQLQLDDEE